MVFIAWTAGPDRLSHVPSAIARRIVWTAHRRNEPALFLDELDAFIAQGGEKSFDILRLKKVGWDQVIQLIERDAAGRTRDLDCPSNCFRQFHLALLEMGLPLKGRAPPERPRARGRNRKARSRINHTPAMSELTDHHPRVVGQFDCGSHAGWNAAAPYGILW